MTRAQTYRQIVFLTVIYFRSAKLMAVFGVVAVGGGAAILLKLDALGVLCLQCWLCWRKERLTSE